jgi:hypothetical protein
MSPSVSFRRCDVHGRTEAHLETALATANRVSKKALPIDPYG